MKKIFISIMVLALLIVATGTSYAAHSAFNGTWRSIDIDGSRQQMKIGGGNKGVFRITFVDHRASFCEGLPILGKGAGEIGSDDVMHTELNFRCLGGLKKGVADVDYQLIYDEASDTLTDAWGVTWNRTRHNP
jgi:hypothetical protein